MMVVVELATIALIPNFSTLGLHLLSLFPVCITGVVTALPKDGSQVCILERSQ